MELERVGGFLFLGTRAVGAVAEEREAAEAALQFRFPASYVEALAALGRGTFDEARWLLSPARVQTYGSLFDEGLVRGPPRDWLVFAASDDGTSWAWSPSAPRVRGEPAVHCIPRGCFGPDDALAAPRLVANDVVGLLRAFRAEARKAGAVRPYFVAEAPLLLVGDVHADPPRSARSVATAHRDVDRALAGAVRLVRFATDAVRVSRWFVPDADAILSIQTNVRSRDANDRAPSSTLRVRFLGDARVEGLDPVIRTLDALGWTFARARAATVVWRRASRAGLSRVEAMLARVGARLDPPPAS